MYKSKEIINGYMPLFPPLIGKNKCCFGKEVKMVYEGYIG